eukprot:1364172-Rhodomonas_salina.1
MAAATASPCSCPTQPDLTTAFACPLPPSVPLLPEQTLSHNRSRRNASYLSAARAVGPHTLGQSRTVPSETLSQYRTAFRAVGQVTRSSSNRRRLRSPSLPPSSCSCPSPRSVPHSASRASPTSAQHVPPTSEPHWTQRVSGMSVPHTA